MGKELETDWILAVVEYLEFGKKLYYQDYYASFTINDRLSAQPGGSLRAVPGVRLLVAPREATCMPRRPATLNESPGSAPGAPPPPWPLFGNRILEPIERIAHIRDFSSPLGRPVDRPLPVLLMMYMIGTCSATCQGARDSTD